MFLSDWTYRARIFFKSGYALWTLPKEDMDAFMNCYKLFEYTRVTDENEKLIKDYYRVLNHLCSMGQVEKMYIPPIMKEGVGIWENQRIFEEQMMEEIRVVEGCKVLELGSGRGRIATHVCQHKNCFVTGLNIDPEQVKEAKDHIKGLQLEDKMNFVLQSYNDPLPFKDQEFDAIYNIQAFTYAKDYVKLFTEVNRILKPGGRFSICDWFLYDKFDASKPELQDLLQRTKKLIGAVHDPTPEEVCQALEKSGFKIVKNKNASINGVQYPLIDWADKYFNILKVVVDILVALWILPKHFKELFHRLTLDGQAFVEGDRLGYWTSVHHIIAEKSG